MFLFRVRRDEKLATVPIPFFVFAIIFPVKYNFCRSRRSTTGIEKRTLTLNVPEEETFDPINVPDSLEPPITGTSFSYNVLVYDEVFELNVDTGFMRIIQGKRVDREEMAQHELVFNMRVDTTNCE